MAFPSIATGVYGYPASDAAGVSMRTLRGATTSVEKVVLVAFSDDMAEAREHSRHQVLG